MMSKDRRRALRDLNGLRLVALRLASKGLATSPFDHRPIGEWETRRGFEMMANGKAMPDAERAVSESIALAVKMVPYACSMNYDLLHCCRNVERCIDV